MSVGLSIDVNIKLNTIKLWLDFGIQHRRKTLLWELIKKAWIADSDEKRKTAEDFMPYITSWKRAITKCIGVRLNRIYCACITQVSLQFCFTLLLGLIMWFVVTILFPMCNVRYTMWRWFLALDGTNKEGL